MPLAADAGPKVRQVWGPPLYAPISISSSGDNLIVSGVPKNYIRVIKYSLVCAGDVVITWVSDPAGAISGPMSFQSKGGISEPYCPEGIMQAALGEDLVLNLSSGVSVGGLLTYILVN